MLACNWTRVVTLGGKTLLEGFSASQIILVPSGAHTHTLSQAHTHTLVRSHDHIYLLDSHSLFTLDTFIVMITLTPSPSHTVIFLNTLYTGTFVLTHTDTQSRLYIHSSVLTHAHTYHTPTLTFSHTLYVPSYVLTLSQSYLHTHCHSDDAVALSAPSNSYTITHTPRADTGWLSPACLSHGHAHAQFHTLQHICTHTTISSSQLHVYTARKSRTHTCAYMFTFIRAHTINTISPI